MGEAIFKVILFGGATVLVVGFVGFFALYACTTMWEEFVDPILARRRKHREDMENWSDYD